MTLDLIPLLASFLLGALIALIIARHLQARRDVRRRILARLAA